MHIYTYAHSSYSSFFSCAGVPDVSLTNPLSGTHQVFIENGQGQMELLPIIALIGQWSSDWLI